MGTFLVFQKTGTRLMQRPRFPTIFAMRPVPVF